MCFLPAPESRSLPIASRRTEGRECRAELCVPQSRSQRRVCAQLRAEVVRSRCVWASAPDDLVVKVLKVRREHCCWRRNLCP